MENTPEFELKVIESKGSVEEPGTREAADQVDVFPTDEEVLRALQSTKGAEAVLQQFPRLGDIANWFPIAFFHACGRFGAYARYLDIWDADRFDGVRPSGSHSNDTCLAWFSEGSHPSWGEKTSNTGVINCYFRAPTAGNYVCTAQLQSYPNTRRAIVDCSIDGQPFGALPFTGDITQPHMSVLSAGGHSFRIQQVSGSFFFFNMVVRRV